MRRQTIELESGGPKSTSHSNQHQESIRVRAPCMWYGGKTCPRTCWAVVNTTVNQYGHVFPLQII